MHLQELHFMKFQFHNFRSFCISWHALFISELIDSVSHLFSELIIISVRFFSKKKRPALYF